MTTLNPQNSSSTPTKQQQDLQVGGFVLKDERGIGLKIYTVSVLIIEIVVLLIKMTFANLESMYRFIFPIEEKDIKGELALITGTGHGIGRELALQFAALGVTCVCVDINEKTNNETVEEIKSRGGKAYGFICDVSDNQKVAELGDQVRATVGEVSILVNNAGIMPCTSFFNQDEKVIKKLFDINVFAHFWLLKAFLPSMISRNHGHVVSLSSMAGVLGLSNLVPYCSSKFAVRGYMESLHEELRSDPRGLMIKFTTIFPYIVDTGLVQKPRSRFPDLIKIVKPHEAAAQIISAMRRDYVEMSIPSNLLYTNNICRNMPTKSAIYLKDFLDTGANAHDE